MAENENKVYQAFKEAAKELIEQAGEGDKIHWMRDPKDGTAAFLESQDGTKDVVYLDNDGVKQYRQPPMIAKLFNDQDDQGEAEEQDGLPKTQTALKRWKTTWKAIREPVRVGKTIRYIKNLLENRELHPYQDDILREIIKAGEAGLLD